MNKELFDSLPGDGWLSENEARMLHRWASASKGAILEVGCFKGRSTVLLASFERPTYCVDPFSGFSTDDPDGNGIADQWRANVLGRGIQSVTLFRQRIEDWEPKDVGLAYLDGDHTYEGTRAQIAKALDCRPSAILIHDVNDSGGGFEVKRAALEALGPWEERVERLAGWRI